MRPGGRLFRSGSLSVTPWGLSGSIGVAWFIRVWLVFFGVIGVRPDVRSESMGLFVCALGDVGISSLGCRPVRSRSLGAFLCVCGEVRLVWCRWVHWGVPWGDIGFVRGRWVHWGALWRSSCLSEVARCICVRSG